jgi:hypothetical protein
LKAREPVRINMSADFFAGTYWICLGEPQLKFLAKVSIMKTLSTM